MTVTDVRISRLPSWLRPELTRWRVALALLVALSTDSVQMFLGPIGWPFADEFLDVIAMVAETLLIGFHVLLLPTFLVEFIPVVGMLPTWTGCVVAVIALRRRQQKQALAADGEGH